MPWHLCGCQRISLWELILSYYVSALVGLNVVPLSGVVADAFKHWAISLVCMPLCLLCQATGSPISQATCYVARVDLELLILTPLPMFWDCRVHPLQQPYSVQGVVQPRCYCIIGKTVPAELYPLPLCCLASVSSIAKTTVILSENIIGVDWGRLKIWFCLNGSI